MLNHLAIIFRWKKKFHLRKQIWNGDFNISPFAHFSSSFALSITEEVIVK